MEFKCESIYRMEDGFEIELGGDAIWFSPNNGSSVKLGAASAHKLAAELIRLAEEIDPPQLEEITVSRFKAGDKVTARNDDHRWTWTLRSVIPAGEVFAGEWRCVDQTGDDGIVNEADMVPVIEEPKFKVGDKVVWNGDQASCAPFDRETVYEVASYSGAGGDPLYFLTTCGWYGLYTSFDLYVEPAPSASLQAIEQLQAIITALEVRVTKLEAQPKAQVLYGHPDYNYGPSIAGAQLADQVRGILPTPQSWGYAYPTASPLDQKF